MRRKGSGDGLTVSELRRLLVDVPDAIDVVVFVRRPGENEPEVFFDIPEAVHVPSTDAFVIFVGQGSVS